MTESDEIYLGWQKALGAHRYIVGVIKRMPDGKFTFKYDIQEVSKARNEAGFMPYTEFSDTTKIYNGNVLDIFAQRMIKSERLDVNKFYDFWEIDSQRINDNFYLLAHSQGFLPTDNFEFLADYNPVRDLHFLTDLDILPGLKLNAEVLVVNDKLDVRFEEDNEHGNEAVAVYKGDLKIGHIKQIHCRVFHKEGGTKLKLKVKALDKNGIIKRAFVKVYNEE